MTTAGREKETDRSMQDCVSKFCDTTTAHGFNHLNNDKGCVVKLGWTCVLVAAFVGLSCHLYRLASKYKEHHYVESTKLKFESPTFLDVTICNLDAIHYDR